ncbi:ATP-dependent DNA helicase UvrD1 [compost metagenome]
MLDGLNERQRLAAQHIDGPALINAGPGTGKTKLVTHRIAHLVRNNADPRGILALTFTNAAAEEMRSRIQDVGKEACYPVVVGTFHSFALRYILKPYAKHEFFTAAGYPNGVITLDEDNATKLLEEAIKAQEQPVRNLLEAMGYKRKQISSRLSINRARGLTVDDVTRDIVAQNSNVIENWNSAMAIASSIDDPSEHSSERDRLKMLNQQFPYLLSGAINKVWRTYNTLCKEVDGVDFDDMLLMAERLVKADPKVARALGHRFTHISLDEFQDVNPVQYSMIETIASYQPKPFNIFAVGDARQSIYKFRAADLTIMTSFPTRFPKCYVVDLVENYRSSHNIIDLANCFAVTMAGQITDGVLEAKGPNAPLPLPVSLHRFRNDKTEAAWMVGQAQELIAQGQQASSIYFLYRNKSLYKELETALAAKGVNSQIVGNISFWETREVKDIIALLRVFARRQDAMAMARVIDNSDSGMTGASFRKVMHEKGLPAWPALESRISNGKSERARALKGFVDALKAHREKAIVDSDWVAWYHTAACQIFMENGDTQEEAKLSAAEILRISSPEEQEEYKSMFKDPQIGYRKVYDELPIVKELRSFWHAFMAPPLKALDMKSWEKKGLTEQEQDEAWARRQQNINTVLDHITRTLEAGSVLEDVVSELTLRTENAQENDLDSVKLMTMHASKGLEADYVFLLGVEQENFMKSEDYSSEDEAEEGRNLYVAMTRPRKKLYMTTAATRMLNGEFRQNRELGFLEIFKHKLEVITHDSLATQHTRESQSETNDKAGLADQDWDSLIDTFIGTPGKTPPSAEAQVTNPAPSESSPDTTTTTWGERPARRKFII